MKRYFILLIGFLLISTQLCFAPREVSALGCEPIGPQRAIVIGVNYVDDTAIDVPLSEIADRFFSTTDSLNDYWNEASYGRASLTGNVFGYYTLNMSVNDACNNALLVRDMALARAAAETDLTQYNRVYIVGRFPGCGFGGSGGPTCWDIQTPYGTMFATHTFLYLYEGYPVITGLLAHESGHNLGISHAGTGSYGSNSIGPLGRGSEGTESGYILGYGDFFDVMGQTADKGHYNARSKYFLGWLQDSDIEKIYTSGTFTIQPLSAPLSGIKALRIFRGHTRSWDSHYKEYLWVETRQPIGYDTYIDSRGYNGALIHYDYNDLVPFTMLLDMSPGSILDPPDSRTDPDFYDAALYEGESFTDPYTGIRIAVREVSPEGNLTIDVTVDPDRVDTDEDGMPDMWEATYGLTNPALDEDSDGLNNLDEYLNGTNPRVPDTDADGYLDGVDNCPAMFNPNQLASEGCKATCIDKDGDGYGNPGISNCSAGPFTDCDDTNASIHPWAAEVCDGVDNDCDGQMDEGVKITYYRDADGDGYGDPDLMTEACSPPAGYVLNNTDCDDSDPSINPGATEVCDSIDNNCNGAADEGFIKRNYYPDMDRDGYGAPAPKVVACQPPNNSWVTDNTDCNDNNASIHPGAADVCDGIDNNCDGQDNNCLTDCTGKPVGTACTDNNACTTNDACAKSGKKMVCKGSAVSNGTTCNDNNACTSNDVCSSGTCKGTAKICTDNDLCTTDSCNATTGACVFITLVCNDNSTCTGQDYCDPSTGCVYPLLPDGTACTEIRNGKCRAGVCSRK